MELAFDPLISNDNLNLNAQSVVPEDLATSLLASGTATLRALVNGVKNSTLVVTLSAPLPTGATVTFSAALAGATGVALPFYNADGSLASPAGVLSAVGTYWADLGGLDMVTATANGFGAGTVNFVSSLSNYPRPEGVVTNTVTPGIFSGQTYHALADLVVGGGTTTIIPAIAGKNIYVVGLLLCRTDAAIPVQVTLSTGGGPVAYYFQVSTNPVTQTDGTNQPYLFAAGVGNPLALTVAALGDFGFQIGYYQF
jgi:hypothetical protein